MLDEALGDVSPDDDGLARDLPHRSSGIPLDLAVVHDVPHPRLVLGNDDAPEESSISSMASVPFV